MLLANFVLFLLGSLATADETHLKPVSDDEATVIPDRNWTKIVEVNNDQMITGVFGRIRIRRSGKADGPLWEG